MFQKIISKINKKIIKKKNKTIFKDVNCEFSHITVGPDVNKNFIINHPKNLKIGKGTVLNGDLYINAFGNVSIGKFCHIGKGLTIFSHNHNWRSTEYIPYDHQNILKPVEIGDAVWIGTNVTISPGVKINDGAIISSGAVVFGIVEKCAIMRGNPAQVIGYRDIEVFDKLKKEEKFM